MPRLATMTQQLCPQVASLRGSFFHSGEIMHHCSASLCSSVMQLKVNVPSLRIVSILRGAIIWLGLAWSSKHAYKPGCICQTPLLYFWLYYEGSIYHLWPRTKLMHTFKIHLMQSLAYRIIILLRWHNQGFLLTPRGSGPWKYCIRPDCIHFYHSTTNYISCICLPFCCFYHFACTGCWTSTNLAHQNGKRELSLGFLSTEDCSSKFRMSLPFGLSSKKITMVMSTTADHILCFDI